MATIDGDAPAGGTCVPCRGDMPAMSREEATARMVAVPEWALADDPPHLIRTLRFPDFKAAQAFAVAVGDLCEAEGHHADLAHGWGYCTVKFYTHKINGLHENDFIMAAKVDRIPVG